MDLGLLLSATLSFAAPLVFAAMGGLMSERSGVINIGLEGKMLIASALTAIFSLRTGNPIIGLSIGLIGSIAFSYLHYLFTQKFRIDHIVSGMAINAGAYGVSNFLDRRLVEATSVQELPRIPSGILVTLAFLLPVAIYYFMNSTRGGLRMIAVGQSPEKSRQMGVSPLRVRWQSLVFTGVFCGLGGALVVTSAGSYVDNITAGRGYIALAALILGGWRPLPALAACIVFGFFEALQLQLQGTALAGVKLPPEFWKALPYLATLFALAGFVGKNKAPSGLGKP